MTCARAQGREWKAEDSRSGRLRVSVATGFPAEAATRTSTLSITDGRRAPCDNRRTHGPVCRQVFGLADAGTA